MGYLQDYVGLEPSPGYKHQINTIIDFWSHPCQAPWYVYIETLYPVLGRLAIVILDTDLPDLARGYLRPREGLLRGPNRKKGRRRGLITRIPDTPNIIAALLPGRSFHEGRRIGPNEAFFWAIDDPFQKAFFWWMVVDLAVDGFYWWAVGMMKTEFCKQQQSPSVMGRDDSPTCLAFAGGFLPAGNFTSIWERDNCGILGDTIFVGAGSWRLTFHASFQNTGSNPIEITFRFGFSSSNPQTSITVQPGMHGQLTHTEVVHQGGAHSARTRMTGALTCIGRNGFLMARKIG